LHQDRGTLGIALPPRIGQQPPEDHTGIELHPHGRPAVRAALT
jgi:hypothetical protein